MGYDPVAPRRRGQRPRRVAIVTGTRAEYGLLRSTMAAIRDQPGLQLQIVATGMHLLREFGHTVDDIVGDGWHVDARIRMQTGSDNSLDQATGLSKGVVGIARFLQQAQTDIVVVLGDRIEAMAGALAAVTTGRILAHIHGGDAAPGDFDDSLRHAITKLAHIHFAATRSSMRRILRMGESPDRVHLVGAPGLDRLVELVASDPRVGRPVAFDPRVGRARSGTALVVHHASGRSPATEARVMTDVLKAVQAAGLRRLIVYPNTDRGHGGVIRAIERHRHAHCAHCAPPDDGVEVVRSLPRDDYLKALINAEMLVGNSSSGIIEAASAGTPSVNVGLRQAGRQRASPSVVEADESFESIRDAIVIARRKRPKAGRRTVYGDGHAGRQIAQILARTQLTPRFRRNCITYSRSVTPCG